MPGPVCRRCGYRLTPVYPGQVEHPLCSPTDTGWIPRPAGQQMQIATPPDGSVRLALELAGHGWHVFPLSSTSKRPLANCPACRDGAHRIEDCPCLPAGKWCHGVRAATTDPARIAAWWEREPDAVPGVAAGPSGLVLLDVDTHGADPPADPARGLLPGIDLASEPVPEALWRDRGRFRDGRDALRLLAQVRGGTRPWPTDPAHRPVVVATPSGGRHLWYRAPAPNLRQALGELAWQVDIKAGWNYGIAPGAVTASGRYQVLSGNVAAPGHMPAWLAREVTRVATPRPTRPAPVPLPSPGPRGRGPAAYLTTVIDRGAADLATMTDGRKRALSALAYQAGGLLAWSGLPEAEVTRRLIAAGTASGLPHRLAHRIVRRALARGIAEPLPAPGTRGTRRIA
ncbi:bifunctional DNA primase/polymerase [Carbonactinospora thermoautotrophica]|uniref:bifunctional DNA primase/polymerase n=1 Tax=Carbonactinospora thermoautotrophica TaxID=1469144 RepID=UPI000AE46F3C|nr:bifunctional DNA primase/polymerase [Carbonactinospora thermoautotrophica]